MRNLLSALSLVLLVAFSCRGSCADDSLQAMAPKLVLDSTSFDCGSIDEGAKASHTFKIENRGGAPLSILDLRTTCGCTTAKASVRDILPGQSATIDVVVDTAMKQNRITKIVQLKSNDPSEPVVELKISMDVHDPHKEIEGGPTDRSAKIFTDAHCASCHVTNGIGKSGRALFNADCAMCHGPKAEGAVGPTLVGPSGDQEFQMHLKAVTSRGSKTHKSMPGFLKSAGGPLSESQIDSIITYLQNMSRKRGL